MTSWSPGNPLRTVRAGFRTGVFFLKVLPTLPSRPVDWITKSPLREDVTFSSSIGEGKGLLFRPPGHGPHPGIVVCLGVVPFGFEHPQVPRLGEALARAGFASLLYRSSHMDDFRLDPEDVGNLAAACQFFMDEPYVAADRCGVLGTCVGGSFAMLAAAHPAIRDQVAFVGAFAPYASMQGMALQIVSGACSDGASAKAWKVDPLTRKVFVHSLTAVLESDEAECLRRLFDRDEAPAPEVYGLSEDGQALCELLSGADDRQARSALDRLSREIIQRMDAMSPINHLQDIGAPLIVLGHDRDDTVIPVGESRRLRDALASRGNARYTEFGLFQHADPTKRKLPPHRQARELWKFFRYVYPMFREVVR